MANYYVYGNQGQGPILLKEFDALEDAAEFVDNHEVEMSFLISSEKFDLV